MPKIPAPEMLRRYAPFVPGIPAPNEDWHDSPSRALCVNESWLPLIFGAMETLKWADLYDDSAGRASAVAGQVNELIFAWAQSPLNCGDDNMYLLRQSPGDRCVLEQSVDNGLTWTTAFDFGLCKGVLTPPTRVEVDVIVQSSVQVLIELVNIYDGDPANIAPDYVYDQGEMDATRDAAMCYAVNRLIASIVSQVDAQATHGISWRDVVGLVASSLEKAADIILLAIDLGLLEASPEYVLLVASAKALAQIVQELISVGDGDINLSDLNDPTKQAEIVCHAVRAFRGATPSLQDFAVVWDDLNPEIINQDVIDVLSGLAHTEDVYLAFLLIIESAFGAVAGGQAVDCDCPDECSVLINYDPLQPTVYIYGSLSGAAHHDGAYSQIGATYTYEGYTGKRAMFRHQLGGCRVSLVTGWVRVQHGNPNGSVTIEVTLYTVDDVVIASQTLHQNGAQTTWRAWSIAIIGNADYVVVKASFATGYAGAQSLYIDQTAIG